MPLLSNELEDMQVHVRVENAQVLLAVLLRFANSCSLIEFDDLIYDELSQVLGWLRATFATVLRLPIDLFRDGEWCSLSSLSSV